MIITKAPTRIGICGGGTDINHWINQGNYGIVVGFALAQHSYMMIKPLPKYFDFNYRLGYSVVEEKKTLGEIEHNVIRNALKYFDIQMPLEIHFISNVPHKSGLGSSSSFVVSLVQALKELLGQKFTKQDVYNDAITIEQDLLRENIGYQDSAWSVFGGLNTLTFHPNRRLEVMPHNLSIYDVKDFIGHFLLYYTNVPRTSSEIAGKYYDKVMDREKEMTELVNLAESADKAMRNKNWIEIGRLMDQSWDLKRSFHPEVSNRVIDNLVEQLRLAGCFCKVSGAGQGSLIVFCKPHLRQRAKEICKNLTQIDVDIDFEGVQTIYKGQK